MPTETFLVPLTLFFVRTFSFLFFFFCTFAFTRFVSVWNVSAPAEAEEKGRDHLLDEPLETGAMSPQGKYENFQPTPTVRIFQMFLIWLGQEKKKQT